LLHSRFGRLKVSWAVCWHIYLLSFRDTAASSVPTVT
jgi:hypothetical protein